MSSKFKQILDRAKDREPESESEINEPTTPPLPSPAKSGRPAGKRSDNDYIQVTAYIRKAVHREVKIALIQSQSPDDFSDLVDKLLENWIKSRS